MTTSDIDQALRVLNIEPLYGHSPHNPPTFRRALPYPQAPTAGTVYFVEDEEIDFDRVLREEKIPLPKPANWTAHWLAVEGVQPLIPENPPAIPREPERDAGALAKLTTATPQRTNTQFPPTPPSPSRGAGPSYSSKKPNQLLVKQVLSRELQLYYSRLTSALLPPSDDARRTAALSSLRSDAGLQTLLPYLVKWVGDGVVGVLRDVSPSEGDGRQLEVMLEVIGALLDNNTLFVEPYVSVIDAFKSLGTHDFSLAPSTAPAASVNPPPLQPAFRKFNAPPHGSLTNLITPPNTALDDVPIPVAPHHEDSPRRSDFPRKEQRDTRRRGPRAYRRRQGGSAQRTHGRRRRQDGRVRVRSWRKQCCGQRYHGAFPRWK